MKKLAARMLATEASDISENILIGKYTAHKSGEEAILDAGLFRMAISVAVSKTYGVNIFLQMWRREKVSCIWHPVCFVGTYYTLTLAPIPCASNAAHKDYLVNFSEDD